MGRQELEINEGQEVDGGLEVENAQEVNGEQKLGACLPSHLEPSATYSDLQSFLLSPQLANASNS